MTDTDKDALRAREILDDPRNFIKDPIAGPIPVHFNALYDVLATALRQARRETWLEAVKEAERMAAREQALANQSPKGGLDRKMFEFVARNYRAVAAALRARAEEG